MSQSQATDCINQIDIAQTKIAKYNTDWNIWDIEYKRLEQLIITKETEIDSKDTELYNWILSELQNNSTGELIQRGGDSCAQYRGSECSDMCRNVGLDSLKTPRGRGPSGLEHYHTYNQHCNWNRPLWETYRCYCKTMTNNSKDIKTNKARIILEIITEKTNLQNQISQHANNMPQFPPIVVRCCDKTIECNNKIFGSNSCFGNLQICRQSNFNILDKSRTTELENNNKTKILKMQKDLEPINEQIIELLNSIFNLSKNLSSSIDNSSISNSILNIRKIYDQISVLMTKIETIRNINNVENEAKLLFDYITTDTTHKREMQSIFESISVEVKNIKNIILQAKNTFSNIKIIYETLQNEDLNINLLKIEQNKILKSISSLNNYLDNLKILYDIVNSSSIKSQDDIDKFLEIYNKSVVLVKNINLEIKDLNSFKNELTNIFNKFTINSFFINEVKLIYNESINNINNITRKINEININTIIENINSIFLKNKKLYESDIIRFDEEKLKIIQDEELKINQSKITNNIINNPNNIINNPNNIINNPNNIINNPNNIINNPNNIDNKNIINNIKQEEISGINIIYILIGIGIVIITIIFLFIKK
jgi:hypothetical protein